jgi:hypothetical protein
LGYRDIENVELRTAVDEADAVPVDLVTTIETMDERLVSLEETAGKFDGQLREILAWLEDLENWREDIATASQ